MSAAKQRVRRDFAVAVFGRDGHRCRACGARDGLDPHHITDRHAMPNGGYVPENGISLCARCHQLAERWHESGHTEAAPGYHPTDLYKLIGSSYERALVASGALQHRGPEERSTTEERDRR